MDVLIIGAGILLVIFIIVKFFRSSNVVLTPKDIAHEWMALIRSIPKDQQINYSNDLIKLSFYVVSEMKVSQDYNVLMQAIEKNNFNASNFVQLVIKAAINLYNRKQIVMEDFDLRGDFDKEMVSFFSQCLIAIYLNTELDGFELLNRLASQSKGSHMAWPAL